MGHTAKECHTTLCREEAGGMLQHYAEPYPALHACIEAALLQPMQQGALFPTHCWRIGLHDGAHGKASG